MSLLSELDIKDGDYLVYASKEYAIRSAERYTDIDLSASFTATMHYDAEIQRRQVKTEDVRISPIDPASSEAYTTTVLQAPVRLMECFGLAEDGYMRLIMEQVKR